VRPPVHDKALDRRAKLAFGVAVICGLVITETVVIHHTAPHPASPLIWSVLGGVAAVALVQGVRWHRQARRPGPGGG
jgi:hypothetical protein